MLKHRGFSLIEVMIALVLIGLVIQTASSGISQYRTTSLYQSTELHLAQIKQALLSHLSIHGYLPCPDINQNGYENRHANGQCSSHQGALPYLELGGVGYLDSFGQRFFYAINTHATSNTSANNQRLTCRSASLFARHGSISNLLSQCNQDQRMHCTETQCLHHCSGSCVNINIERNQPPYFSRITPPLGTSSALNGALRVCNTEATNCSNTTPLSHLAGNQLPAVIISYGKNGRETWQNCSNANPREQTNCNGDRYFQLDGHDDAFDDMLVWLTIHEIKTLSHLQLDWYQ
ncbi:type II secretion system protein [Thiomicrospira microaerophila]|uniref:type II secretion system protein n=1 Tax=Thiomicrospira microaerophila TaxID=406020 RepID=UPI00200BFCA1|nr:type II secretion system protein [Thiomicrospira microaerophila]UQB41782.1 type II secretion system protein [Thiomicrospira microaerophila]